MSKFPAYDSYVGWDSYFKCYNHLRNKKRKVKVMKEDKAEDEAVPISVPKMPNSLVELMKQDFIASIASEEQRRMLDAINKVIKEGKNE